MQGTQILARDLRWYAQGVREGPNYASDGYSHLMNFAVNGLAMGTEGSEIQLAAGGGKVTVTLDVAAMLDTTPDEIIRAIPYAEKP